MARALDDAQRTAARVVGVAYLLAMASSMIGESTVRGSLLVKGDAVRTAQNIIANTGLFRLGIACEMLTFAADLALIAALYVVLAPVNRHLALFATLVRAVAEAVCVTMAAGSFDVLRLLNGAPYMKAFDADQLAALVRVSLGAHAASYSVAFVYLGLGSAVSAYLWVKSSYVPRAFGVLGVIASLLLSAGTLAGLMVPWLGTALGLWYMLPMFLFEVGLGVWLLARGLHPPARAA